jgi:hypothetical protein
MAHSYRALCSDFYLNMKLAMKLELPRERQPLLDLFDRMRRQFPDLEHVRRYRDELALEAGPDDRGRWLAVRPRDLRAGVVNPDGPEDALAMHRQVLELAPYYLGVTPLDVDYLELLFGFDLPAEGDHSAIVCRALLDGSPLAGAIDEQGFSLVECQPAFGVTLSDDRTLEAFFEVRTGAPRQAGGRMEGAWGGGGDPISIYVTLRRYGPVGRIDDLPSDLDRLAARGEDLVAAVAIPRMLNPIREMIGSGGA